MAGTDWDRTWRQLHDPLTWLLGAVLLTYETVIRHGQDDAILVLVAGLMGLPIVRRADERRNGKSK